MTIRRPLPLLLLTLLAVGCAGPISHMRETPGAVLAAPPPGKAVVVFMRPSSLGFAIASSVYELKAGGDTFVGIVPAKRKVTYVTDPGSTRFMVVSEAADFMAAELEAGKTYYALVTPRMGMMKARFSLHPVTAEERQSGKLAEWDGDCVSIENTPASQAWAKENWSDIQNNKIDYLQKWEPRTDKPTLRATDGR
jgi:hypothetical protein